MLANAPAPGPNVPLVMRGDADGNLLAPEEDVTTDEEGLEDQGSAPPLTGVVPGGIARYLRSYQREGVQFLFRCALIFLVKSLQLLIKCIDLRKAAAKLQQGRAGITSSVLARGQPCIVPVGRLSSPCRMVQD